MIGLLASRVTGGEFVIRHLSFVIVEERKEDERLDSAAPKVSTKQTKNLSPPS
jgi:hypothetical protein